MLAKHFCDSRNPIKLSIFLQFFSKKIYKKWEKDKSSYTEIGDNSAVYFFLMPQTHIVIVYYVTPNESFRFDNKLPQNESQRFEG